MRVSVYHNIARDEQGRMISWFGYQPGHPLVHVIDFEVGVVPTDGPGIGTLTEEVWIIGNANPQTLTGAHATLARAYRARRLRSLLVGDVVVIGDGDDRVALSLDKAGLSRVDHQALRIVTTRQHGTEPWPADTPPIQAKEIPLSSACP
ncbi:hypothetical protein OG417_44865 [Actinoallomurus sp. NBC_01490]|uniref:hypothetical protein n=1 Tax=Actinoallomurus sp. NBC_01490 TaxID=2903557 RepID=UPI002E379B09|nr:hypothetical protein [Actinoallomurus sp. NBC_01490]